MLVMLMHDAVARDVLLAVAAVGSAAAADLSSKACTAAAAAERLEYIAG
jgi:hypothetical protein